MRKITDIKEMQEIALGLLLYLDEICREHGLKYFVSDGTLLGTIRHQGFIPWDDDVDVWLPREDYEKLEKIVNSDAGHPYRVLNHKNMKGYYLAYGKLVHTGTSLVEHFAAAVDTGVFIDLFPYDGLPEKGTAVYDRHMDKLVFLDTQRVSAFRNYHDYLKGGKGGIRKMCKWAIRRCYGGKRILDTIEKECKKYPIEGSPYVACMCGGYRKTDVVPREAVASVIRLPFEGHMVNVPVGYETYLRTMYGDYMKLPPENERVPKHESDAWWRDQPDERSV